MQLHHFSLVYANTYTTCPPHDMASVLNVKTLLVFQFSSVWFWALADRLLLHKIVGGYLPWVVVVH